MTEHFAQKPVASSLKNMIVALFLTGAFSALLLGFGNELTKDKIAQIAHEQEVEALKQVVVGDFDNNPFAEAESKTFGKNKVELYPIRKDGKITSIAIKSFTNKGFGGDIEIMVGFYPNGRINRFTVIKQQETPGLGSKIMEKEFYGQLDGFDPNYHLMKVRQDGGEIDAVTGATVSSRAVLDALKRAYETYINFSRGAK